jgi:hypothetical protein
MRFLVASMALGARLENESRAAYPQSMIGDHTANVNPGCLNPCTAGSARLPLLPLWLRYCRPGFTEAWHSSKVRMGTEEDASWLTSRLGSVTGIARDALALQVEGWIIRNNPLPFIIMPG